TFTVVLGAVTPAGAGVDSADITTGGTGTGTITNDDTFGISVNDSSANEGSDVTFTITVDAPRSMDVDVTYTTADGTATLADSDYTQHVGTVVTIPAGAGNQTQPFTVATTGDTKVEDDEAFTVTVSSTHGSYDGNDDTGTGTITDNDEYSISISGAPSIVEGTQASFTVTVTPQVQTGDTVTVQYSTADGSAVAPGDYNSETNTVLAFIGGESSKNAPVDTNDDAAVENDETFTVTLNSPTTSTGSVSIADPGPKTGTITDNDEYSISISGNPSVVEGTQALFTVTVTPQVQTGDTVTVQYSTTDGSAAAPGDYAAETNAVLTFNGGDSTLNATVDTNDDTIFENDETFAVALHDPATSTGSV
ncbi:MAG: hypothetical protein KAS19_05055, partial [Anaerolineales bacterium]|nr:hypothetical protein [Anaerolineales bacterium]